MHSGRHHGHAGALGLATIALALIVSLATQTSDAAAKTPGKTHCYKAVCHRVMTLEETHAAVGRVERLATSHYDHCRRDRFNPCGLTSSGAVFEPEAPDNAASAFHPDGTVLLVRNPATKAAVVVRVNNFGPFKGNRRLDLSRAAAEHLGFRRQGIARLDVMVVQAPTAEESRYKKRRRYEPVPGPLGQTASIESAFLRYADLTLNQRIARLDAIACQVAAKQRTPRLKLIAATPNRRALRLARG